MEGFRKINETTPDIILCDIMMPELSGLEVLKKVRQQHVTANIPFVFLSAAVSSEYINHALPFRPDAWIEKPFTERSLISTIRHVLHAA